MANPNPDQSHLNPVKTKKEARKRGRNGGIKSGEVRREKKLLSQMYAKILAKENGIGPMISYTNSKDAILYGIEGEMIFDFGRISKSLSNFSLGFNGTLMQTKVTLADKIINPINGQLLDNIENVYQKGQRTRNLQDAYRDWETS